MWRDPIVEEVRKAREEHAARFAYDLEAIYQDLKETERRSGRKVVSLPPKRLKEAQREPYEAKGA
jgi:hypothetical protein